MQDKEETIRRCDSSQPLKMAAFSRSGIIDILNQLQDYASENLSFNQQLAVKGFCERLLESHKSVVSNLENRLAYSLGVADSFKKTLNKLLDNSCFLSQSK